ncbi:citrate lyase holo-[acyl-carrier protein] synthase [Fructilactobacillus sp. Tb1]|uniref:citrate lyase holo-[acyl-carrier protein] synthase n=1 Tax=Fructilactobacillus sp. Tb1 TaxID=3422304 RepID=UPI003D2E3C44
MKTIFAEGNPQSIEQVLNNKDHRNYLQHQLVTEFPEDTVVTVKLNIPGPIKNNQYIAKLFKTGEQEFITNFKVLKKVDLNSDAGPETLFVVSMPADQVKQKAIAFEDEFNYRRLFDIDVLNSKHGHYSRVESGYSPRKCLICNQNAKECARSRQHSVAELQDKISKMYDEEIDD